MRQNPVLVCPFGDAERSLGQQIVKNSRDRGSEIVSISEYARRDHVNEGTIRHQIVIGIIARVKGGVDVDQADASWRRQRRSRIRVQHDDDGLRAADARIAHLFTRLRAEQDKLAEMEERYIDWAQCAAQTTADMATLLAELRRIPEDRDRELANQLGIEAPAARRLLQEFINLALAELGDLPVQAALMVQGV